MSAVRAGGRVGRFVLRDVLGRGAQATVWRAHDERLDRDVALKLLAPEADASAVSQWLHEARAVSRLTHPHIVPVFEADEAGGQAWLVFELVAGRTLAERLRADGVLPDREAVAMMRDILDALAAAHAQGLVHRDLKPSNVLLDANGRARVMDFGIAARVNQGDGRIVGTPGYMSPEAARGEPPQPQMDVFAAGTMLAEMLTGRKLLVERDPWRAVQRVQSEDLVLPEDAAIDDALRSVLARAIARPAAQRWAGAAAMRDELARWLRPAAVAPDAAAGQGTLDFLLRRMRHKSDFPALSDAMSRIQRVAGSDSDHLHALSGEILKDVALTNKLLRLVNSVGFRHAGGGTISTISRAVALVGFANVRNMAMSLVLLEHMQDKAHAARLREEFLRSLAAGQIASELTPLAGEGEEAYLGAMLSNLGRLLTEFYFPEEANALRALMHGPEALGAEQAALQVLGIGLTELGQGVARAWGLPESLQRAMALPADEAPQRALPRGTDRQRWVSRLANDCADAVLLTPAESLPQALAALAQRYGSALGVSPGELGQAVQTTRTRLGQLTEAVGLKVMHGTRAQRLLTQVPGQDAAGGPAMDDTRTVVEPRPGAAAPAAVPEHAAELLSAGIHDVTNTLAGDHFRLNDVLRMILETMFRSLGFQRVVFALRDARSGELRGRFGLGADAEAVARAMQVSIASPGATPDLFTAVCLKGADTLIADAGAANIAPRLPAWFRRDVRAPSFLLLPMAMKGATFGLIYADLAHAHALNIGERELALLRTLRNQAVMAFKQAA